MATPQVAPGPVRRALRRRYHGAVLAPVLTWGLLALLLPLAMRSLVLGILGMALVAGLTLVAVLGFERAAMTLFFIGFATAPMDRVRPVPGLDIVAASDLILFAAVICLAPVLLRRTFGLQAMFLVAVLVFVSAALVASAVNPEPIVSLFIIARLLVGAILLPVLFAWWRPRPEVVVALALAYVGGAGISVAQAVLSGDSVYGRYIGLTMHPNILGLCSLLAVALVPFLLSALPRWTAPFLVVAAGVNAYGVWISGSRAALVVAILAAGVYVLISRSINVVLLFFGLSIAPVWIVARAIVRGEEGNNALGRLLGNATSTPSDLDREMLRQVAIDNFTANPLFGVGFGDVLEAHNVYLQIAAAGGIITVAAFLLLMGATLRQAMIVGPRYLMLAIPAISYIAIAPLTSLVWDRYIWTVLALPFLLPIVSSRRDGVEAPPPATPGTGS